MGIEYYLAVSNGIKVGGYDSVDLDFVLDLAREIYTESSQKYVSIANRFAKYSDKVFIEDCLWSTIIRVAGVDTSSNNSFINMVYRNSKISEAYAELGFIMFVLGLVNGRDYLAHADINFVMQRIGLRDRRDKDSIISHISVSRSCMCELFITLMENSSMGIDYGFSPYDFVWSMCELYSKDNIAEKVWKKLSDSKILPSKAYYVTEDVLKTYTDEVAICLVCFIDRFEEIGVNDEILFKVLYNCQTQIRQSLFRHKNFVAYINRGIVKEM